MSDTTVPALELFEYQGIDVQWAPYADIESFGTVQGKYLSESPTEMVEAMEPVVVIPSTYTDCTGENPSYHEANRRVIERDWINEPWLIETTYSLGGSAYAIALDRIDMFAFGSEDLVPELIEVVQGLEDYGCLDDEMDTTIRDEWVYENVDDWLRRDIVSLLSEEDQGLVDDVDEGKLNSVIVEALWATSCGPELEYENLVVPKEDMPHLAQAVRNYLRFEAR